MPPSIRRTLLEYPHDIRYFIGDIACRKWVGVALREFQLQSVQSQEQLEFDQDAFIQGLVAFVTSEVCPHM